MWNLVSTSCGIVAHLTLALAHPTAMPDDCARNIRKIPYPTHEACQAFVDKITPKMRKDHDHDSEILTCEAVPTAAASPSKP